jgi:hypothetical protein
MGVNAVTSEEASTVTRKSEEKVTLPKKRTKDEKYRAMKIKCRELEKKLIVAENKGLNTWNVAIVCGSIVGVIHAVGYVLEKFKI